MRGTTTGRLEGIGAVITGAASGIGLATAERFDLDGARTLLVDVDADGVRAVAGRLGERSSPCPADLGDDAGVATVVESASRVLGHVDVLVNNAGISSKTPFLDVGEAEWDRLLAVNVFAPVALASAFADGMVARRSGCILNVSSISALGGGPGQSVYGITKGALLGLTRELAARLAPYGVRVNAVLPGVIDTPMVRRDIALGGDPEGEGLQAWIRAAVPLARIGGPEEVAAVLSYLASARAEAIVGALVPVEGGYLSA